MQLNIRFEQLRLSDISFRKSTRDQFARSNDHYWHTALARNLEYAPSLGWWRRVSQGDKISLGCRAADTRGGGGSLKLPSISQTIYPRLLRKLQEITGVTTHGRVPRCTGRKWVRLAQMYTLHHEPMDKGLFLITDLWVFFPSTHLPSFFRRRNFFPRRRSSPILRVPPSRLSWESIEVRTTICWSPQSSVEDKTVRIGSRDKVKNVSRD